MSRTLVQHDTNIYYTGRDTGRAWYARCRCGWNGHRFYSIIAADGEAEQHREMRPAV